jgi:hypothetical protein
MEVEGASQLWKICLPFISFCFLFFDRVHLYMISSEKRVSGSNWCI